MGVVKLYEARVKTHVVQMHSTARNETSPLFYLAIYPCTAPGSERGIKERKYLGWALGVLTKNREDRTEN